MEDDPTALLNSFLEIYNRSMTANRDKFPYCHIWRAVEHKTPDLGVGFVLMDDRPKACCHISLVDGELKKLAYMDDNNPPPARTVRMSYVEEVVKSPEKYIADPSLLNWDWMRSR
jgi:hypothetical protein